jgi:hypothetical protein
MHDGITEDSMSVTGGCSICVWDIVCFSISGVKEREDDNGREYRGPFDGSGPIRSRLPVTGVTLYTFDSMVKFDCTKYGPKNVYGRR